MKQEISLKKIVVIIFLLSLITPLYSQRVVRIAKGYIALENENIGKKGERLIIRRMIQGKMVDIGIVCVVVSKQGKTAAAIEKEYTPYHIQPGDMAFSMTEIKPELSFKDDIRLNRLWRFRIGFGPGKRIGDLSQNIPPEWKDYHNQLKSGFALFSDVAYFYKPTAGFGLMILQGWTHQSKTDQIFIDNDTGLPVETGDIENHISILYAGPVLHIRQPLAHSKMNLCASATAGFFQFTDEQNIRNASQNIPSDTISDQTLGIGGTLGCEIQISRSMAIFGSVNILFGTLPRQNTESNLYQDRISLNRIDVILGLSMVF